MTPKQFQAFWAWKVRAYYPQAPESLKASEQAAYLDVLYSLPESKVQKGLEHWVKVRKEHWYPNPADMLAAIEEAHSSSTMPADAQRSAAEAVNHITPDEPYNIWRMHKLLELDEEAYMSYITGRMKGEGKQQETAWRQEYEQSMIAGGRRDNGDTADH